MKHISNTKRRLLQIVAFGYSNPFIGNFLSGNIYKGKFKNFCNPGMNCYSCPAASLACPIGAMQAVSNSMNFSFSFYVIGIILAIGSVLGRWICGFLCPFGFIQDIINKLPFKKIHLPKLFTYVKYIILVVFVLILPIFITNSVGIGKPTFCEFICPVGTLESGLPILITHKELSAIIGNIFTLKIIILLMVLIGCVFISRFFCKTICPLGAIYGLLNRISLYKMKINKTLCIDCGICKNVCVMDINPVSNTNSAECIRCMKCINACQKKAIKWTFSTK